MRLQFDKSGRRFFFLTFCVRGRKTVLSRIVKKTERDGRPCYTVELTPSDVPVFPVNYDNCHLMNARNEALCRRATGEEDGENFVPRAERAETRRKKTRERMRNEFIPLWKSRQFCFVGICGKHFRCS
jgi:hypothetical protein